MGKDDGDALPPRQRAQRQRQSGLDPGRTGVGHAREHGGASTPGARTALADPVQVPDGVLYGPDLLPVLPGARHGFCESLLASFDAETGDERPCEILHLPSQKSFASLVRDYHRSPLIEPPDP